MTARAIRHVVGFGSALAVLVVGASRASAQGVVEPRGGRMELGVSALLIGPASFGTSPADLTRPDGSPLTLFTTENGVAIGAGAEVHVGVRLVRSVSIEGTVAWSRARLESRIRSDAEGAVDVTVTETLARFTGEGSVLWTFASRGRTSFFVRGGAGWMSELAGDGTYHARGLVGNAGAGMKYWRRTSRGPERRGLGLRLEGRARVRSNGISLGNSGTVVAPELSGGITLGF